ncbi:PucR family transcriptional regulator [Nocardia seriolae]|nr:helix-turn-helix domain-containing protein [Nocardia seriolae]MTJ62130.1 PucR family transcriptional regulator [Nocardia seriolae]MTJ72325.1 PucR family transcriptional regulator [Nocardia seriolae]MTJ87044.1 PucR family transcriptional regulator [Nocardia seriolae]MTK31039.1 PucR family transcriptional regulator [Nocardia seriolae]MTK40081.1 PucR family transcriptional regulator [Nocardia seriolae]
MAAPRHPVPTLGTQRLAAACQAEVPELTKRLMAAIATDNPEWTDYTAVPRADLRDGCKRYLTRILELLRGQDPDPVGDDVAAAIGRRRAEQGVPLEAMLRTFRLGGQIVWEALLDKADDIGPSEIRQVGSVMWAVVDGMSSALVASYRTTELERVRSDERRRHSRMEDLLAGRAHDATFAARAGRELNLPPNGAYLVVVAQSAGGPPLHMGAEAALGVSGIRSVWHDRVDSTVGLVSLEHRDSSAVLQQLRPLIRGRAGVSPTVPGLASIDTGHGLAALALETVSGDAQGLLVSLDERYPEALLLRSPDLADLLVSRTLGPVLELPPKERDILLTTLAVWLAENCSAANAAPRLHCHRNTVINRLQRITMLLGRPLEGQRSYVELSLALAALELPGSTHD